MRISFSAMLLVSLCGVLLPALAMASGRGSAQYSASVVILSLADAIPMSGLGGLAKCEYSAKRLRTYYTTAIQIIPTVYWQGNGANGNGLDNYCIKDQNQNCQQVNAQVLSQWQGALQRCYQAAANYGFQEISIVHHVDRAAYYTWRALLDFVPTTNYGGYSYDTAVLAPSWRAAKWVIKGNQRVWWTLGGEMGYSTFKYPASWHWLLKKYKKASGPKRLVGTNLNYQKTCNCVNTNDVGSFEYAANYAKNAPAQIAAGHYDKSAVKSFLYSQDFMALSNYVPVYNPNKFGYSDFDRTFTWTQQELLYFGFDLYSFSTKLGKPIVIAETGFGGGYSDGVTVGPSLTYIAQNPFYGTWYPATTVNDPWTHPGYSALRQKIYGNRNSGIFGWLLTKGTNPNLRIDWVYTFPVGSYDAFGIQYDSWGFHDTAISNNLKLHNKLVRGIA